MLTPASVTEGLRRLMDEALVLPQLLDRQAVQHLIAWVRELQFFDLRLSSLDEAENLLRGLTSPTQAADLQPARK